MFFNGLIRPYGDIDASAVAEFIMSFIARQTTGNLSSTISLFNDSQWMILDIAYKDPTRTKLYVQPPDEYHAVVDKIQALIGQHYYVVQSMIAWMPPGTEVSKHVDLQKMYANTRRLHVQLVQNPDASMSVYAGDREHQFNFMPGAVYELNNRTYHSAKNTSTQDYYAILVIDFAKQRQIFTDRDNVDKDTNLLKSDNLPLYSYH
jgi:hypothetical protein